MIYHCKCPHCLGEFDEIVGDMPGDAKVERAHKDPNICIQRLRGEIGSLQGDIYNLKIWLRDALEATRDDSTWLESQFKSYYSNNRYDVENALNAINNSF